MEDKVRLLTAPNGKTLTGFAKTFHIVKVKEFISSEVPNEQVESSGGEQPTDDDQEDAA